MNVLRVFLAAACMLLAPGIPAEEGDTLVLTSMPATYGMASALVQGTRIRVENVPADGRPMGALARYLEKPPQNALAQFKAADAVVTIGKLWREDPFYAAVRAQNIRVVNIDATEPYSTTLPGIALVREPDGAAPWRPASESTTLATSPSRYFWLSPSSSARAADIIAHDLMQLSPRDAQRVAQNLAAYRRGLFELKNDYEAKFAALDNVTLFALSPDFVYLTTDVGLFVDGYFFKQDIDWTPEDLAAFGKYLKDRSVRVVIHRWEPSTVIQDAIKAAGAKLIVLRTAEAGAKAGAPLGADAYLSDMKSNLAALHAAFSE